MGNSCNENPSVFTTSWHSPLRTVFGKNDPISASFGSIFTFSKNPCGDCMSINECTRSAISSSESTSSARHMRFKVPTTLVTTGTREPFGLSNSSAGPPAFTVRSEISVISYTGSTSISILRNSSFFSSVLMKSRKSRYATSPPPALVCNRQQLYHGGSGPTNIKRAVEPCQKVQFGWNE